MTRVTLTLSKKSNIGQFLEFLHKIDHEIVFAFYLVILRKIYDETGVDYAMSSEIDQRSLGKLSHFARFGEILA